MASSRSSARSTAASRPELIGCETPRVFTPPLRKLEPRSAATEKRTLGYAVIDFAHDVLGMSLLPWQRWLLVHMLELLPNGSLRFRTVLVLVARQNGKSTLSIVLSLFFMYVLGRPLVIGTAQDLDVAETIWQGAVDLAEETDELAALIERVVKVNGKKALELTTGEQYKVKAANRRAGRGLSGDLVLLDELREHQSWDAWGAITKTTMARAAALVVALSNAGDAASIVLRYLRLLAHLALGNPDGLDGAGVARPEGDEDDDEDLPGIFEWSAKPGCAIDDRDGWRQANPSLGYTITTRAIRSAMRTDPEWVFRTEVLCQWSDGAIEGPFPDGKWAAALDEQSSVPGGGRFVFGVDVSWDRSMAYVAAAGPREDGLLHVEVVASRPGTEWIGPWLEERKETAGLIGVTFQAKGAPVSSLADTIADTGVPVVEWGGSDLGRGTGALYDLVRSGGLRHRSQPVLDLAASTARTRPVGDAWLWDRKRSPHDAAPLVAVTAAAWAWSVKCGSDYDIDESIW